MPMSGIQAAFFNLPSTKSCGLKGLDAQDIVQPELMCFKCIRNVIFFPYFLKPARHAVEQRLIFRHAQAVQVA